MPLPDFKGLFQAIPVAVLVIDRDFAIVAVTDAYLEITQLRREHLIGKDFFRIFSSGSDLWPNAAMQPLRASFHRVFAGGGPDNLALQNTDLPATQGRELRYRRINNSPMLDERGEVQYVLHRVTDAAGPFDEILPPPGDGSDQPDALLRTEKVEQNSTAATEPQLQTMVDTIPQLAWIANADGWIFWYNRRWYEYTGTTAEQMEGWGWQSVHDPKELPKVLSRWKSSIESGEPFDMSFPLRSAAGEFRWFLTRVSPLRDGTGKIIRWFGTNTDVHELRELQQALLKSQEQLRVNEERLRLTQRAAGVGSWELYLDRDEFIWTDEVFTILGLSPERSRPTVKTLLSLMFVSSDRDGMQRALKLSRTRQKDLIAEFRIRDDAGETRWIAARGRTYFNQGQSVILGVLMDVTHLHEGEAA